jgi:pimeloyl-ACP methyl ester carboxylesterase
VKRALPAGILIAFAIGALTWLWLQNAPLDAIVRGGEGPPTLVLLHGYGSNAEDWLQFVGKLQVPNNGRLIFPQAPRRGPIAGGRGWWWLNIEGHIPEGERFPDFSTAAPGGIKVASQLLRDFLQDVDGPIILGGFSQGAMLSGEVAFQTDQDLAGLVMIAGTTVNEAAWVERFPGPWPDGWRAAVRRCRAVCRKVAGGGAECHLVSIRRRSRHPRRCHPGAQFLAPAVTIRLLGATDEIPTADVGVGRRGVGRRRLAAGTAGRAQGGRCDAAEAGRW